MKRLLPIFSAILLFALLLSGCSAKNENINESDTGAFNDTNTTMGENDANISTDKQQNGEETQKNNSSSNSSVNDENKIETYKKSGEYVYFGEFPQSLKASSVSVSSKTDSRGYHLGDDGNYYAKVVATPCEKNYSFSLGASIDEGDTYFFKVEPIKWKIISQSNGEAILLCDSALVSMQCDGNSNNYKDSELRAWLNNKFMSMAFTSVQKGLILDSTLDNSAASTGISSNQYACANTTDKVYLLSYVEALKADYGFNTSNTNADKVRMKAPTDYAKATGAYLSDGGKTMWWLRSPSDNRKFNEMNSRAVSEEGTVIDLYTLVEYACVVPALKLKMN